MSEYLLGRAELRNLCLAVPREDLSQTHLAV